MLQLEENKTVTKDHYTYSEATLSIPNHDTDLKLVLPNGRTLLLQYRVETTSMDICLAKGHFIDVLNWGEDMKSAPTDKDNPEMHNGVNQLVLMFEE